MLSRLVRAWRSTGDWDGEWMKRDEGQAGEAVRAAR